GSIREANAKRLSLAVIHPDSTEVYFEANPTSAEAPQFVLFDTGDSPTSGARRFAWMPRLRFHDECGWNNLMLRDWGTFELQRKKGEAYFRDNLAGALHLDRDSSLLVGNMNNQRTSWLVISVLNGIREAPSLFSATADQRLSITDKLRRQVYERDEWACVRCGSPDELTIDHKWPHSRGGNRSLENLQTLCSLCNSSKNDAVGGRRECHGSA
ncbi:MAG: HNH endonuclease, partial [Streptosporangiales bacterium]